MTLIAAGVSTADVLMRENNYFRLLEFPFVPGRELIGFTQDGRRVAGFTSEGAYAEKVAVRRSLLWEVPDELDHDEACALTLDGQIAWHLLHTALAIRKHETIIIPNAASAVGIYATQLAKLAGCRVIAMDSGDLRLQIARDLKADAVVDYTDTEGLADRIREAAGGHIDAAIDMTGDEAIFAATLDALGFRGRMVIDGSSSPRKGAISRDALVTGSKSICGFWLPPLFNDLHAMGNAMQTIFEMAAIGALKTPEYTRYPLEQAESAHRALAAGFPGKIILNPRQYWY
ncbi:zinc-binding dehydrogenase [Streptomyces sp. VNUA116]|uniref:quinone oxidoreductase family protein n=1 Tax=Streptomyces sp. VNUA116 TaxID=3062449 RepID=UPI002675B00A|nr:zinc-binding dehydrogenase [Streptomyces sp. VNUA116]WKU46728.1 zinc-binding dehydrogenase [Streptomyces sp. VNUA116]